MTRHYARKVDRNHAAIVSELRQAGLYVLDLSRVGDGCPDLLVARGGRMLLAEIKAKGKRRSLTDPEREFFDGWPIGLAIVAESAEEVLQEFGLI